jgi:transposase
MVKEKVTEMASKTTAESEQSKRLTRKQRKDLGRRIWSEKPGLDVVHRDAAGIDIGSREHYVAVGPDRDAEPVRVFGCFTTDLQRMAEWLKECGVKTVVMQSTGVYWIPVYDVLEQYGFDVWLVNARDTKNLPGRKSDVQESQWLLKLHTYGLLRKSFRPTPEIRGLRTCWRERSEYVQQAGACIQRMQKALTEMNVQVATVLSDLSGVTGMSILRSIVAGERDGMRLAQFRDPHVKASEETIAKSLEGTWLPEQLAILKRQLADWDHVQQQMVACDVDLQAMLKEMPTAEVKPTQVLQQAAETSGKRKRKRKGKSSKNEPSFDLTGELKRVTGVDLSRIDGIKVNTIQTVVTEAGLDMNKWPTEDHFVSWIGLSPRNDVSGGKVLKKKTRKVVSRLATALRMAATTLRESDSYLGAQFRRLRTRLGAPKAITAMAAKLSRLIYRMLRYGQEYVDKGTALYEQKYRQQQIHLLGKKAAQHGFALVPLANSAQG